MNVQDSIAAHAVRTMNASCDFTRREETRDHFTLTVDDLSFTIDSDPAHRVMNRHTGERSPKRSLFDLEGQIAIGLSELWIYLLFNEAVVFVNGLLESIGGHPHLLCKFFDRIGSPVARPALASSRTIWL